MDTIIAEIARKKIEAQQLQACKQGTDTRDQRNDEQTGIACVISLQEVDNGALTVSNDKDQPNDDDSGKSKNADSISSSQINDNSDNDNNDLMHKEQSEQSKDKQLVIQKYESEFSSISKTLAINDPSKCQKLLYVYFKKLLMEWDEYITVKEEEEQEASSAAGIGERNKDLVVERKLFNTSQDYMKPFFHMLKAKKMEGEILQHVACIAQNIYACDFAKALDYYMKLSIGNKAWPIGITAAILHERKALDRISGRNISHPLNNETVRRWVQCLKRLITFKEKMHLSADVKVDVNKQ
ncbi:hypothetical protein MP228_003316 [Amoeboaphelidium protococcarum]|nr:hypothetical protein MP228_003316 [Amoeboaphelidium protococcarum]